MAIHASSGLGFPFTRTIKGRVFRIDMTQDPRYLDQTFSLRYQVFNLELQEGLKSSEATQRDRDRYDDVCEHLVVIDELTDHVIATYRILPYARAQAHHGFYSETEFDLKNILRELPHSAEIGRCCVQADFRDGTAMNLLWCGLAMYMEVHEVTHMFGCTSLEKGTRPDMASEIYTVFKQFQLLTEDTLRVMPQPNFAVPGFQRDQAITGSLLEAKRRLPRLLRGYLSGGIKICGDPAYDPEFGVIDFFSLLDYVGLSKVMKRFVPS